MCSSCARINDPHFNFRFVPPSAASAPPCAGRFFVAGLETKSWISFDETGCLRFCCLARGDGLITCHLRKTMPTRDTGPNGT